MKKYLSLICLLMISSLYAVRPFKSEEEANTYMTYHFNRGCHLFNKQDWRSASDEFERVVYFFPTTEAGAEAGYCLAVCYYHMREYDFANVEFTAYISAGSHPEYFEEAIYYKYAIAQELTKGKKRRPFQFRYLPKCMKGEDLALTIYDEIVSTVPNHEMAVCSLFAKANLQFKMRDYRESVDTYQTLIRRFPKHELAPECYLKIGHVFYDLSKLEYQNPDILGLAELNAKKFREEFPRDERVSMAEKYAYQIKEVYAAGLCRVGQFYERTSHPEAASIYYLSAIEEYPDTKVAGYCRRRLTALDYSKVEKEPELIPLDEEQYNPRPIMLDPLKMDEQKEIPGYEIPIQPLVEEGKVIIE